MVTLDVDFTDALRHLTDVQRRQVPFATSLALNRTADEVIHRGRQLIDQRFTVRRDWVKKGFRVDRSTRSKLEARVYHKDPFMWLQEHGGEKEPASGKQMVAAPIGARPTPQTITTPGRWPGALIQRHKAFTIRKGDTSYLFQRLGRTKRGKIRKNRLSRLPQQGRDPALRLMYVMKPEVDVPARWGFLDEAQRLINARWPLNFSGFMDYAIRTAR